VRSTSACAHARAAGDSAACGVGVDLARAGVDERVRVAHLGVALRLIHVEHHHADRADVARHGAVHALRAAREQVRGGERHLVRVPVHRLPAVRRGDARLQLEGAGHFAAGRIELHHHAGDVGVGHCPLDERPEHVVRGEAGKRIHPGSALDQRAERRHERDA
jgi:hypothetical protein